MPFEIKDTVDIFTEDLQKIHVTDSPPVIADADLVYVLSGRSTVLGADADHLPRPFDLDEMDRLAEGIRLAKEISAKRLKIPTAQLTPEQCTTPIFYNGRKIHNRHLKIALKRGQIPYPSALFIIAEIMSDNTIGQAKSFVRFLQETALIIKNIFIVGAAPHLPRIARTFGLDSPQVTTEEIVKADYHLTRIARTFRLNSPQAILEKNDVTITNVLGSKNIFLFAINREFKGESIGYDIPGEVDAMRNYSSGFKGKIAPSISRYLSKNTFFTSYDIISRQSFNLQMRVPELKASKQIEEQRGSSLDI